MNHKLSVILLVALCGTAQAQLNASVDLSGVSISSISTNPPDVVRTSATTIDAAGGYTYTFNPIVRGTGLLGLAFIPNPTPLGDVLNSFVPGQYRVTYGAVRNPSGGVPVRAAGLRVGGTFTGITVSLDLDLTVLANRRVEAAVRRITKPIGLGLAVDSGAATLAVFNPPAPVYSEWQFEGDLRSVKETGAAATSGPAKIRYLDDPAFGAILGGPGSTTTLPNPPTPHNITRNQSAFGLASSFGLPPINGEDDTVYRTSPTRNLSDPGNRTLSRGIGLALWPNTRDSWPDDKIGCWTMVWDLYIPATSWNTEWPVALIEDNHNNDEQADCLIRQVSGTGSMGYQVQPGQYVSSALIGPDRWMRIALVSDGYRTGVGRMFVNGTLIGTTVGDWVYNSCRSLDPRYGDVSTSQPVGTVVPPATWNSWGQFPSPWALSPNSTAAPVASTICLFADLQGRGESVYIANLAFVDEAMTDAAVQALGAPNARGIFFPRPPACEADLNGDGVADFNDYLEFLNLYNTNDPRVDFNLDGIVDFNDYLEFLNLYNVGC